MKKYLIKSKIIIGLSLLHCLAGYGQNTAINRFNNKDLQTLLSFQYNRQSDSLYPYFKHPNSGLRQEAALSFSSIGDTNAVPLLIPLLIDTNAAVRKAAAFSLGQYKNTNVVNALIQQCKLEKQSNVMSTILEAIGRCADTSALQYLIEFKPKNNIEKAGLVWGFYRGARRGILSEKGTKKLANFLSLSEDKEVSIATAYYFYQSKASIDDYFNNIMLLANKSKHIEVRIAAVRSLRKTKNMAAANFLMQVLQNAKDYRLRVDAINTLKTFPYDYCKTNIIDALKLDMHTSVKVAAAEYFVSMSNKQDFDLYVTEASNTNNWRIRDLLLHAALKTNVNNIKISDVLKKHFISTNEVYERQLILASLAENTNNLDFILNAYSKESYGEILATFSETLLHMKSNNTLTIEEEKKIATLYVNLIQSKNKYLVMQGLLGIMTPEMEVKKYFPNADYIQNAKIDAVPLFNQQHQSYQLFDMALAYYNSTDTNTNKLIVKKASDLYGYSTIGIKPIDWKSISAISINTKVLVKTTKGNFVIQLLVNEAPFTANAFLDGVKQHLFDSLQFYRVVPNFVNQTGGTMNATKDSLANLHINSEYNMPKHLIGSVNMASNGRDTETTHFSIMLCPTPWNDNAYAIFGKVVKGMNVVHKIELSDYIISMNII
jgi:cyclophilin family peptidyl-prolyl cis-trans isomerase/HEAT repeat protein